MTKVIVRAPAKINLTLNIEGKRQDGYHLLSSVFQSVSLADVVTIEKTMGSGIALTLSDSSLPCDERNTAHKAACVFFEKTGITPCVSIYIEKCIPQQAGLGGGSADAAGVLVGLNTLFEADLSVNELCKLGERVGADVPFCIIGGTAMVTGIGEIIEPLSPLPKALLVIAKPAVGVSTAAAYAAVDSVATVPADQAAMVSAIENGDLTAIGGLLSNAFEQALNLPEVQAVLNVMRACKPLGCMMSGSGSAVYALFEDTRLYETIGAAMDKLAPAVQHYACECVAHGATVIEKG